MRRTPGGKLSFRLPLVKNSGVVRALVFVVQTLKDGFRFFVAIGGTARELIGDREAEQTQRGLVLGICGKDIPADRFSFTWFVQIAIELGFRDRFGNAVLRNRFELKIHFHLCYLSDFDFNVQAIDANVISAYALTCGGPSTWPVVTSNTAPCHGQVTSTPSISPSHNGPPTCVHVLSMACNEPPTLKSAISLPFTSTILAWPAGMSSVLATFTNSGICFSVCLKKFLLELRLSTAKPHHKRGDQVRSFPDNFRRNHRTGS